MHESGLIADLVEKIGNLAADHSARRVVRVNVSIGALTDIGPDHFREHFVMETRGTVAEGAEIRIKLSEDPFSPGSHSVLLESVELEP